MKEYWQYVLKIEPFAKEEDVKEIKEVNEWDLLIEFTNGDKYLIDTISGYFKLIIHNHVSELSEEYEKKEFAYRLRTIMGHKFITQEELAERVGLTQAMISRYVRGEAFPNGYILRKMSIVLNCSMDDFFDSNY